MTEISGKIVSLARVESATELATAAVATDTTLDVVDPDALDYEAGTLRIGAEDHAYTVDEETGQVTLATALADDYDAEELVYALSTDGNPAVEYIAQIIQDSDQGEPLPARVRHALIPFLPVGIREEGEGELVRLVQESDGSLVVEDVVDREPVLDGTVLDPGTGGTSDGDPPASSPTPTVTGGPGWFAVKWTEVANADQVTYDIHVSTTTGFTPSGATLAGTTVGTLAFIRREPDGDPLAYGTTYYFKLIARDVDGSAAAGSQDSEALNPAGTADITVGAITADLLEAVLVISTTLATGTSGQRVEIDEDGIRLLDASDDLVVELPVAGDPYFRGVVEALGLEIEAANSGTPADENKVRWLAGGDEVAFAAGYEVGTLRAMLIRAISDSPSTAEVLLRMVASKSDNTHSAGIEAIFDETSDQSQVDVISGVKRRTLLDQLGQSEFTRLAGGVDEVVENMGQVDVTTPGGAAGATSSTIAHGLGGTPEGIEVSCSRSINQGTNVTDANPRDEGSTTFTIRVQTLDNSNLAAGSVRCYWRAWRKP